MPRMAPPNCLLSDTRIKRIRAQGYFAQSAEEVSALAVGNRFAYQLCSGVLIVGVATANLTVLKVMMGIAFLGVLLPNHPFDYLYNFGLRQALGRPKLPKRSPQLKFACGVATLWLGATIYLFASGLALAGYVCGAVLAAVASTVATVDFCLPSTIFNAIFRIKQPAPKSGL